MTSHPSPLDLVDVADGDATPELVAFVTDHLRSCPACRVSAAAITPAPGEYKEPLGRHEPPSRHRVHLNPTPPLAPRQLWRLTWDDTAVLAITADTTSWSEYVPTRFVLDTELPLATDPTQVIVTGSELAIHVLRATVAVPCAAFDRHVGHVNPELLRPALDTVKLHELQDWTTSILSGWAPDDAFATAENLADDAVELQRADWCTVTDVNATLDFDLLHAAGLPVPRALALVGGETPTREEYAAIESTGVDLAKVLAVPRLIRTLLDDPASKSALRERAERLREGERETRLALANRLREPVAARSAPNATNMRRRLEDLLNE